MEQAEGAAASGADTIQRAVALAETGLLDAAEHPSLQSVAQLAAWICGTPMAAVTLVQDHRQFFAASVGLAVRQSDRDSSFCAVAMQTPEQPMLVPDALADPRFAHTSRVVGDPHIRSYAGMPLVAPEGVALGAVCALGRSTMDLSPEQIAALRQLGAVTVELLQARRLATHLTRSLAVADAARTAEAALREQFQTVFEHAPVGMALVDLDGHLLRVNEAFCALLHRPATELIGMDVEQVQAPAEAVLGATDATAHGGPDDLAIRRALLAGGPVVPLREKHYLRPDGSRVPALVTTSLVRAPGSSRPVLLHQVENLEQRRAAESRLLELQSAQDGIITLDSHGLVTGWNRGAERLLGHPPQAVLGEHLDRVLPLALHAGTGPDLPTVPGEGSMPLPGAGGAASPGRTVEVPTVHADGRRVLIEASLAGWEQDGRAGYTAVLRDVTARRRTAVISELVRHAASTANQALTFAAGTRAVLSDVCERLGWVAGHGWTADQPSATWVVLPHQHAGRSASPASTTSVDGANEVGCPLLPLAAGGGAPDASQLPLDHQTRVCLTREGLAGSDLEPALLRCRITSAVAVPVLTGGSVIGMLAFYLPEGATADRELLGALEQVGVLLGRVVEREQASALLRRQANHDPVTGLANRRALLDAISATKPGGAAPSRPGVTALVLLDLDRFSRVNTNLGYTVGDSLLREAAQRLRAAAAPEDLVARLGADEFVVLVRNLSTRPHPALPCGTSTSDQVAAAAALEGARLLAALAGPVEIAGQRWTLSASVGVCPIGSDHSPRGHYPAAVLRDADAALRHAKQHGKGRVEVFDTVMREKAQRRMSDENDLAASIAAGALTVHYQPVVDLHTGVPVGAEALVRWPRPGHGLVPPDQFIPLAESSGLIVELGRWVLNQACTDAAHWPDSLPALSYVSVNVSARQLTHPRFLDDVAQALSASGLASARLVLEITETALIEDRDAALAVLGALRNSGVRLALDDFGTGYSSLSYVQTLPVDILKIDKSFVDPITGPGQGTALSEVVLKLAAATGLRVIAEGIESPAQAEALRQLGCHSGQGYTWFRPLPLDQLRTALQHPSRSGSRPRVPHGLYGPDGKTPAGSENVVRAARRRP